MPCTNCSSNVCVLERGEPSTSCSHTSIRSTDPSQLIRLPELIKSRRLRRPGVFCSSHLWQRDHGSTTTARRSTPASARPTATRPSGIAGTLRSAGWRPRLRRLRFRHSGAGGYAFVDSAFVDSASDTRGLAASPSSTSPPSAPSPTLGGWRPRLRRLRLHRLRLRIGRAHV